MKKLRILSLGAGVQSTAVFLLPHEGIIAPIDFAIFGDTQEEPRAVYDHLTWLRGIAGQDGFAQIIVRSAGKLGNDLARGVHSTGQRFASIPAFTAVHHEKRTARTGCNEGIIRRQCTKEYKVEVVDRAIRRDVLGLKPRQRMPKDVFIEHLFGISFDEKGRADRIRKRFESGARPGTATSEPSFPLIEMKWTRADCIAYLKDRVPHEVPRSACVFCPFKGAAEWLRTKQQPEEWARAVEIDRALRIEGNIVNRNMDQAIYLHRQCIPLEMVDLEEAARKEAAKKHRPLFDLMCDEGMCGV